jgi:hypothetical protein
VLGKPFSWPEAAVSRRIATIRDHVKGYSCPSQALFSPPYLSLDGLACALHPFPQSSWIPLRTFQRQNLQGWKKFKFLRFVIAFIISMSQKMLRTTISMTLIGTTEPTHLHRYASGAQKPTTRTKEYNSSGSSFFAVLIATFHSLCFIRESPYEEVRAAAPTTDDPDMLVNTFRV